MLNVLNPIDQLGAGVFEVVLARIEEGMDDDEAVLGDRAGEHRAPALAIERGQIRTAAGKAHAKRCAGNNHEWFTPGSEQSRRWRAGHQPPAIRLWRARPRGLRPLFG